MVVRKLKAAIYECVLAHSLCNAVSSTGPCGTPFRRRAEFRVSSVPPALVALASTAASRCQRYFVPSVQIRCISTASLRATATAARRRPRSLEKRRAEATARRRVSSSCIAVPFGFAREGESAKSQGGSGHRAGTVAFRRLDRTWSKSPGVREHSGRRSTPRSLREGAAKRLGRSPERVNTCA